MAFPVIKHVRAFVVRGGGADYHDQGAGHWIDDHIATPMSRYPEYRQSRQSFGINVLGTLVVEIEAADGMVAHLDEAIAGRRAVASSLSPLWPRRANIARTRTTR